MPIIMSSTGAATLSHQTEVFLQACVEDRRYLWREDLLQWQGHSGDVCTQWPRIPSPLSKKYDEWCHALQDHPDREFVGYILKGLLEGFEIGWELEREVRLVGARHNLPSAEAQAEVVDEYLGKELKAGRIVLVGDEPNIHISPFGVIPKKEKGKWRLIVDLSYPKDHSVNDGISDSASIRPPLRPKDLLGSGRCLSMGTDSGWCSMGVSLY